MRTPIIAGNWKMNHTISETKDFMLALKPLTEDADCSVVICVPFTDLKEAKRLTRGSKIKIGAQNVHFAEKGAYTGEVSVDMLRELRVDYVILGHSERRQYFGETNEAINKKVGAALAQKIKPIVCVGETLAEREAGKTNEVIYKQLMEGLGGYTTKPFKSIVIAYEPIWAIGTGKTASPTEANETISYIRKVLTKEFHKSIGENTPILYGGSMNAKNCKELMDQSDIDGGLIGGASLKVDDFNKIIHFDK